MKVLEPLRIQSSPSRTAVVFNAARSEPPEASVMPMAVRMSPETKPGSQRSRCSSVVSSTRYGATMSAWMPWQELSDIETLPSSSHSTALYRKSPASEPPYCSGISRPSSPCRPKASHISRGNCLASTYLSQLGLTSRSRKLRTESRKDSWSAS